MPPDYSKGMNADQTHPPHPISDYKYLPNVKLHNAIPNWLSIRKAKNCLFSRRNGYEGKIIFGYSIRLRLFGKDII